MNQTELLDDLRDALSDLHMLTPLSDIVATGRARRRRRALAYAGGVTAIAALAASVTLATATGPAPPAHAELAAFTVASQPTGATTLTLLKGKQYRLDPAALRQALSDHGIAAVVRLNTTCASSPSPQSGLDQVVVAQRTTGAAVTLTINPSALGADEELSIGYYSDHTTWGLVYQNRPLSCH